MSLTFNQVAHVSGAQGLSPVEGDAALGPGDDVVPKVGLLLPDTDLPVRLQERDTAELGDKDGAHRIHPSVVCLTGGVELGECRGEDIATAIETMSDLGIQK